MKEFDYIIIGGGSAGCVLANRLSEDPKVQVCLLESGPKESLIAQTPLMLATAMADPQRNWNRQTVPQPHLNGRRLYQPSGRGLGGGSAINSMVYVRGYRTDYDAWLAAGNAGWGWNDVLPYFRKSESHETGGSALHGDDGPLSVSHLRHVEKPTQVLLDAARECGYPVVDDFASGEAEGVGLFQVTQRRGLRCSAARAYLRGIRHRNNLLVRTGCHATRISIDQARRANGVEYRSGNHSASLVARREIVLSAGAVISPQLLMLSGIGHQQHLAKQGINCTQHLPGVGENFQDHLDVAMSFDVKNNFGLGISPQVMPRLIGGFFRFYLGDRRGIFASNVVEGGGFIRTNPELVAPDIQFHFITGNASNNGRKILTGHGITLAACVLRPESRGHIRLPNQDPMAAPLIDPQFLSSERDLETMISGVKAVKKILTSNAFSPWRLNQRAPDFELSDEQAIIEHIRANAGTAYHPSGTCKMGPAADEMAVVDPSLRVHGIRGLRVADTSIMPDIISGNTNAAAMMIGEKASDLIKTDWH